jgi:short-subunit dehydrogenase
MDLLRQGVKGVHVSVVMPGMVTTGFALNATHSKGPSVKPPANMPQPQSVEEVVDVMARLIDQPRAEIFTNPAAAAVVERYVKDVGAFEEGMPL